MSTSVGWKPQRRSSSGSSLRPLSVVTLVVAVDEGKTARSVLDEALAQLLQIVVLYEVLPSEPETLVPRQSTAGRRLWHSED